ncbi:MAG TPA: D-alanine--D-alanine ligase [Chlorobaculum parvum]|uniref:D-alanine--D-alanine ligase n=1 Tax=Chlorobaculum parvum TaxID=274539 RepID=A0A7C5HP95_9CHLB|nr:D-alanine--D-alanine ligase [Chlorobaculum parvum]
MSKQTVALFFGGKSVEHIISIISARAVAAQIDRGRYDILPLYIDHEGRWHGGACAKRVLSLDVAVLLRNGGQNEVFGRLDEITSFDEGKRFDLTAFFDSIDVAFLTLHGSNGEDGKIQGCLDTFGIPYAGCGLTASALAMDKALTKLCAVDAGVAVAPSLTVMSADYTADPQAVCDAVAERFDWPVFVKPASLGSSVGISKVHDALELRPALDKACALDAKVLVEETITGHEVEVAVLGNDDPIASVPGEIIAGSDFYDFEDKYVKSDAKLVIPANLSDEVSATIRNAALSVFKALGCEGMARVDFFVEHGTNRVILNEINTLPGFTDISMYPMLMAESGVSFDELVEKLLQLALEKRSINPKI